MTFGSHCYLLFVSPECLLSYIVVVIEITGIHFSLLLFHLILTGKSKVNFFKRHLFNIQNNMEQIIHATNAHQSEKRISNECLPHLLEIQRNVQAVLIHCIMYWESTLACPEIQQSAPISALIKPIGL